jgi:FixJ family two-component response regulator
MNIKMRGFRSLEFQQGLSKSVWNVPVIFISERANVATSVRAMKQGAMDFLLKPIKEAEFLEAIRKALQRARKLREDMATATQVHQKLASLTMREREVLLLVVSGMLNKQIAATLGTSEKTIKVHRHRVMEKMGVQSLAQLARLAERARLPIPKLASYASSSEYSSEAIHLAARSLDLGKSAFTGRATERFRQWAPNPASG